MTSKTKAPEIASDMYAAALDSVPAVAQLRKAKAQIEQQRQQLGAADTLGTAADKMLAHVTGHGDFPRDFTKAAHHAVVVAPAEIDAARLLLDRMDQTVGSKLPKVIHDHQDEAIAYLRRQLGAILAQARDLTDDDMDVAEVVRTAGTISSSHRNRAVALVAAYRDLRQAHRKIMDVDRGRTRVGTLAEAYRVTGWADLTQVWPSWVNYKPTVVPLRGGSPAFSSQPVKQGTGHAQPPSWPHPDLPVSTREVFWEQITPEDPMEGALPNAVRAIHWFATEAPDALVVPTKAEIEVAYIDSPRKL